MDLQNWRRNFLYFLVSQKGFSNYAYGEPNNMLNEDCVVMIVKDFEYGKWGDVDCPIGHNSVCKRAKGKLIPFKYFPRRRRVRCADDMSETFH